MSLRPAVAVNAVASSVAVRAMAAITVVTCVVAGCAAPAAHVLPGARGAAGRPSDQPGPVQPTAARGQAGSARPPSAIRVVVIGDSIAAGAGLPPLRRSSPLDRACDRSADSYARDLAAANGWRVTSFACDGARIGEGLLGPQFSDGQRAPAQVGAAARAGRQQAVILSIGANDLDWTGQLIACAAERRCGGAAGAAAFQRRLASFAAQYQVLLARLARLPGRPRVLVNEYYDPFGPHADCLAAVGLGPARIEILRDRLNALNAVLAAGAARRGFPATRPGFSGHQFCDRRPWVQGLLQAAPLHPTAAGEQAIARADTAALRGRL